MNYQAASLEEQFSVPQIFSIHYFEYRSDFTFPGESHDFWELIYVDKGEVAVTAGQEQLTLGRGEILFHQPNEFHSVAANGVVPPNLVVISFDCRTPAMDAFRSRRTTVSESERRLLAQIITEARGAFSDPLDNPYQNRLTPREDPVFGSSQLIRLYLEQLLIHLYRGFSAFPKPAETTAGSSKSDALYDALTAYLEHHVRTRLTVGQICRDNLIGSSQLKKLFRERAGCGVMACFNRMKINRAKELIRSRQMNFTQIADYLGYASIHYFSRQFSRVTGMTPSEYTDSVKKLAEPPADT